MQKSCVSERRVFSSSAIVDKCPVRLMKYSTELSWSIRGCIRFQKDRVTFIRLQLPCRTKFRQCCHSREGPVTHHTLCVCSSCQLEIILHLPPGHIWQFLKDVPAGGLVCGRVDGKGVSSSVQESSQRGHSPRKHGLEG